jgi:D-3-phosphoglycerate dehydrogenase
MKIAILDDYQDVVRGLDCFSLLNNHEVTIFNTSPTSQDELVERLYDKDGIVLIRERTQITHSLLSRLPNLKLISQTGKISSHIDLDACNKYQVAVAEGMGSPIAPSELCWSMILAASRHVVPYSSNLRQGIWQNSGNLGLGRTLNGLTIGIWGYGKIGQRIARYAQAFEMKVLVWGSVESREKAVAHGFDAAATKEELFSTTDVLSLHLRLNDATKYCVTYDDLQQMKKDALLINISRAELIEPNALFNSLSEGRPGFAAIDVYDREPAMPDDEPLLKMPIVLCSPHICFVE